MDSWLENTYALQLRHFDYDVDAMAMDERREYIRNNLHAAMVELAEVSQALPIKYWKTYDGAFTQQEIENAVEECVDALHFIANVLIALGVDDDELKGVYEGKRKENIRRQAKRVQV